MSEKVGPVLPIAQDAASGYCKRRITRFLIHGAIVLTLLTGYLAPRTPFWQSTLSAALIEAHLSPKQAEHLFL